MIIQLRPRTLTAMSFAVTLAINKLQARDAGAIYKTSQQLQSHGLRR